MKPPRHNLPIENWEIEDLKTNYQTMSCEELAKRHGRTLLAIRTNLSRLGLVQKAIPRELARNWRPNKTEHQVIIGTMLGDACINKKYLSICHSVDQKEYTEWIAHLLTRLKPTVREYTRKKGKNVALLNTRSFDYFLELKAEWYPNGAKIVPKSIKDIEPLGLAIWFQDDGSRVKSYRHFTLSTQGFDDESVHLLKEVLNDKFNIKTKTQRMPEGLRIHINAKAVINFERLIRDCVHPSMHYKLYWPFLGSMRSFLEAS